MGSIVCMNLVKRYGDVTALDGVSFKVDAGEVVGLLGPNGSGKSTTMKILLGFVKPDGGYALVEGVNPVEDPVEVRRRVGYVPENIVLYESLTPKEYFEFVARVRGLTREEYEDRVVKFVKAFEIEEYMDVLITALSKGSKQKVALISALLHEPDVLILDEPLMGLDATSARIFKEYLRMRALRGAAVLLSTHIMEIAEKICDRIVLLHRGRVVVSGSVDEVKSGLESLEEVLLKVTGISGELREVVEALS
ncbi:ABC transporter ATP-binding protein [Candidatus Bathyarchaeota archaeon]|nr:ABC transporter ATP-binding protein [Candidatus Bathyarchaeota archaeon]